MKRVIEIKGAEGGRDAQLFAHDLINSYIKLFQRFS